jgi:hypothetical protein
MKRAHHILYWLWRALPVLVVLLWPFAVWAQTKAGAAAGSAAPSALDPQQILPGAAAGGAAGVILLAAQTIARALYNRRQAAEDEIKRKQAVEMHQGTQTALTDRLTQLQAAVTAAVEAALTDKRAQCKLDHTGLSGVYQEQQASIGRLDAKVDDVLAKLEVLREAMQRATLEDKHRTDMSSSKMIAVLDSIKEAIKELHADRSRMMDKYEMLLKRGGGVG